jgi:hypothetical protein
LRQTHLLIPGIDGSDHFLILELSIRGTFAQIPSPLFYRREGPPRTSQLMEKLMEKLMEMAIYTNIYTNKKITTRHCRLMFHCLMAVKNAPFSFKDKLKLMVDVSYCAIKRFGVLDEILRNRGLLGLCRRIKKLGNLLFKRI